MANDDWWTFVLDTNQDKYWIYITLDRSICLIEVNFEYVEKVTNNYFECKLIFCSYVLW